MWWFGIPGLEDGMKPAFSSRFGCWHPTNPSFFPSTFFYAFGKFLPLKVFIGLNCNFCIRYTYCSTQLAIMLSHLTTEPFLRQWVLATLLDSSFPCHLLCPRSLLLLSPAIFFVLSPFSFSPIERERMLLQGPFFLFDYHQV